MNARNTLACRSSRERFPGARLTGGVRRRRGNSLFNPAPGTACDKPAPGDTP